MIQVKDKSNIIAISCLAKTNNWACCTSMDTVCYFGKIVEKGKARKCDRGWFKEDGRRKGESRWTEQIRLDSALYRVHNTFKP